MSSSESFNQNSKHLTDLHETEKTSTHSLRQELEKVRKDNVELEANLHSRTKAYQATLGQLQKLTNTDNTKYIEELMAMDNLTELKEQVKKLHEKYVEQQAHIKKLEFELEMEQGHVKILKHDNQVLRQTAVDMNAMAEQEEEYISNKLLKRISGLKKEKGELLLQVEQEEEYMTNMLQKKLNQLQREKIEIENSLEQEQEFIVNKLQKQLDSLMTQPMDPFVNKKRNSSSGSINELQSNTIDNLLAEISILKNRTIEMEKEFLLKMQQCNKYKTELIQFRKQADQSTEDIQLDEGIPAVFRTVPPSPGRSSNKSRRSASISSQRSLTNIPPLQLDESSSNDIDNRSRSNSINSRRISGTLLSLATNSSNNS